MKIKHINTTGNNPNMPDFQGNHYKIVLTHNERQMTMYYSAGYGIKHLPTVNDITETLRSEYFDGSIDDFVMEFGKFDGYERVYRNVMRFSREMVKFFGSVEAVEKFVYGG